MPASTATRERTPADEPAVAAFLAQRGSGRIARLGRLERAGAVDDARRTLKPELAPVGDHGIPLRDELILEKEVAG